MSMSGFINIGFGNIINADRIVTIINPDSAPAKRMVQRAKETERLVDATQGRRTKKCDHYGQRLYCAVCPSAGDAGRALPGGSLKEKGELP